MKAKKIIVICISIIVPIVITILVGLYSFGYIGGWTKNQEKFINNYYDEQKTSEEIIETYVKFNSTKYLNYTSNVYLFEDYTSSPTLVSTEKDGSITLDDLSFQLFVTIGDETYNKYSYDFYFHSVNNNEVDMSNIVVILFETTSKDDISLLKQSINDFKTDFSDGTLQDIYKSDLDLVSKNNFFTNGDPLYDLSGIAKVTGAGVLPRLLYKQNLGYTYAANNVKIINSLSYCDFMIVELNYDSDDNPVDSNILCVGQIDNIKETQQQFEEANDVLEGYGFDTLEALKKAGYSKYIMPTVLLHSGIALVISGGLGVMFYLTWKSETKKKQNINTKK